MVHSYNFQPAFLSKFELVKLKKLMIIFWLISGLNFLETKEWPSKITPVIKNKSIVVIYSCGAQLGQDALPKDYLGDYVRDVFRLVGFTDFHQVRMTGVMSASRDTQLAEAEKVNLSIAELLNKKLI